MKKNVFKLVLVLCIFCTANTVKAQAVITEFFAMNGGFSLDVKDKRIQKLMSNKNVLDIDWNENKRVLSVSYPLVGVGKIDIKEMVEVIKKVAETPFQPQKTEVKVPPVTPF
jgi:hypothetical protein